MPLTHPPTVYFTLRFRVVDGTDIEENETLGGKNKGFPLEILSQDYVMCPFSKTVKTLSQNGE